MTDGRFARTDNNSSPVSNVSIVFFFLEILHYFLFLRFLIPCHNKLVLLPLWSTFLTHTSMAVILATWCQVASNTMEHQPFIRWVYFFIYYEGWKYRKSKKLLYIREFIERDLRTKMGDTNPSSASTDFPVTRISKIYLPHCITNNATVEQIMSLNFICLQSFPFFQLEISL